MSHVALNRLSLFHCVLGASHASRDGYPARNADDCSVTFDHGGDPWIDAGRLAGVRLIDSLLNGPITFFLQDFLQDLQSAIHYRHAAVNSALKNYFPRRPVDCIQRLMRRRCGV